MDLLPIVGIAFGLAMDAFSVAVVAGLVLGDVTRRQSFRLSFHFGLFQFVMPILGWVAGELIADYIAAFDHWIAFVILSYVGGRMIHGAVTGDPKRIEGDPTTGVSLVILAVATSIDAFAVGLSLNLIGSEIIASSIIIGVVAAAMTFVGLKLGKHIGQAVGQRMEIVGGVILVAIGIKIVVEHTLL